MAPEKFRRYLRQEAEHWCSEGLIDAALYEKLAHRYQFQRLEQDASNRFITILVGLGAVLLGLGAITFVAANWQAWPRAFKVILLLSCFMGVNVAGFHLWQHPLRRGWQRLGHGLLLLGGLLLGANMALMSQMFHQSGQSYELFLIWGLGVALMAYGLRLIPLGVLALILVTIGYVIGWPELTWNDTLWQEFSGAGLLIRHLPIALSLVFVPLGYRCRSRVIIGFSALMIAVSFVFNLRPLSFWRDIPTGSGWWLAIAFILPPALLWSYQDPGHHFLKAKASGGNTAVRSLAQPMLKNLALVSLAILFYVFAFQWWWRFMPLETPIVEWLLLDPSSTNVAQVLSTLLDPLWLGSLALLGWLRIGNPFRARYLRERYIDTAAIALMLWVATALFIWGQMAGVIAVITFNLLLFSLAIGLIRDGLVLGLRSTFWWGMMLLVTGIISRMLEYDTGLLLKAVVFTVCGVGMIVAGLNFEHNHRDRTAVFPSPGADNP